MSEPVMFPRLWCMPNRYTFAMLPARKLLDDEMGDRSGWCDPFAGQFSPAPWRNDIDPEANANSHLDALEYLRNIDIARGVLFDPPYTGELAKRLYNYKEFIHRGSAGLTMYMSACKNEIARIIRSGGKVISFGWNSNGMGMKRGFTLTRGLLIAHGGGGTHDTIVTVEVKQ